MMSKSKSPLFRGLRVLYVLPLVCLGLGLQARTVYVPADKDSEKIVADNGTGAVKIVLNLTADGKIDTGGSKIEIPDVCDFIKTMDPIIPGTTVIQINAAPDVPMSVVDKLKNELRKVGMLKVEYSISDEDESVSRDLQPAEKTSKAEDPAFPHEVLPGIRRENVCVAYLNANDRVFFNNNVARDDAEILRDGKAFLKERGADAHFLLRADKGTSYGAYLHLQTLIRQIYDEVRDEKSRELYGKALADLSQSELDNIYGIIPLSITETAPVNH